MSNVTKAVIPAAGYGTRMLPVTKTVSKEIMPLVDKPVIQYVVEDLVDAGITDIIIVTSQRKADLVDYFSDVDSGLLEHLRKADKQILIKQLEDVHKLANIAFIEQKGPYGTGTPVLNAEPYLGGEPFVYMYADNFFIHNGKNAVTQLLETFEQYDASIDGCLVKDADEDYDRYGYVAGEELLPGVVRLNQPIAEQPGKANAPGKLAQMGMFVVKSNTLSYLHSAREQLPVGKELYFHTAFNLMLEAGETVIAKEITDALFIDTGNKLEYMKSAVRIASRHPEIGQAFTRFIQQEFSNDQH